MLLDITFRWASGTGKQIRMCREPKQSEYHQRTLTFWTVHQSQNPNIRATIDGPLVAIELLTLANWVSEQACMPLLFDLLFINPPAQYYSCSWCWSWSQAGQSLICQADYPLSQTPAHKYLVLKGVSSPSFWEHHLIMFSARLCVMNSVSVQLCMWQSGLLAAGIIKIH